MKRFAVAITLLMLFGGRALAEGGANLPPVSDPATLKECGACHMAYQPEMLPMRSWHAIMTHLSGHFGEDASLPETTRAGIENYLVSNAGDAPGVTGGKRYMQGIKASSTPLRITDTQFWRRGHGEISTANFTSPTVKTKANCVACHRSAVQGQYGEEE
jgi:hypothetical protein